MPDRTEDNPKLQAVVSLLTTGPVGIGDRIGYTDVDLVHRWACFTSAYLPKIPLYQRSSVLSSNEVNLLHCST